MVAPLVTPLLPAQLGGSQAFAADLAVALGQRGHDVWLVCAEGSRVDGARLLPVLVAEGAEAALVRPGSPGQPAPQPALQAAFASAYRRSREVGVEVLSQHGFDPEAIEAPTALPTLHTLHLPPLSARMVDAVRASSQSFATVSGACASHWAAAGIRGLTVLANGVPDIEPPSVGIEPIALIAGRISPEKGTDVAIRVARLLDLQPVLAGGVYDQAYYDSRVRPLGARELGPLARSELWTLMCRSTVALLAADWEEPFGLVAAEAQMAGCPVAAYARGGLGEVIEDGVGGCLARAGDQPGLVDAGRRARALDRGEVRASARRRLSIAAAAERYERVLAAQL